MLNVGNTRSRELHEKKYGAGGGISMLSMYNKPPVVDVTLEEFEEYAIDRLHVLKAIETFRLRTVQFKDRDTKLDKILNRHLPLRGNTPTNPQQAELDALKDVLSHFFLRMAFCQSEDLRRWFLAQESSLFRFRLDKMSRDEKLQFMKLNGISYEEATPKEIEVRSSQLKAVRDAFISEGNKKERFAPLPAYFKVPFTDAIDLMAGRKVYLEMGIAYVPFEHVVSLLHARFRSNLSHQLATAYRKFNRSLISKDERLAPVLSNLAKQHIDADFAANSGQMYSTESHMTPEMIDNFASQSMPLCMKSLHKALKVQHHLKFQGRQQYGLFLKATGLQLDDAIAFWRQEFCKKMTVDDFNKKYAYNIRHNYGKEGKRKDYTPYSCMRIITGEPPKSGEYHGCPFRHFNEMHLRKAMGPSVSDRDKNEILALVEGKHYQVACKKYFEATHAGYDSEVMIAHPNGYFQESRNFYMKTKQDGVPMT